MPPIHHLYNSLSGNVVVSVSGDFKKAGEQGRHCSLPQTSDVTINVGDVTVTLKVNKSPGVTQDAPVFVIGDDGRVRRDVTNNDEVRTIAVQTSDYPQFVMLKRVLKAISLA